MTQTQPAPIPVAPLGDGGSERSSRLGPALAALAVILVGLTLVAVGGTSSYNHSDAVDAASVYGCVCGILGVPFLVVGCIALRRGFRRPRAGLGLPGFPVGG
jgi:hypothetical protein